MLLENGKTGLFCFTRVGEPAHISKISYPFGVVAAWPPGGGVMTLHDYRYLPPEVLKSYPVSE